MTMTTLPSSVVCDTADYFKFNDSLTVGGGGNSCPTESLIWLCYNVKVQEDGHTTLRVHTHFQSRLEVDDLEEVTVKDNNPLIFAALVIF